MAIVGPANAGKSTLANRLLLQDRSIVADLPGTTRDWVGETANLDGLPVMLIDTPGIRETDDPIERAAIQRSIPAIDSADLVILVLDATRPLAPEQQPLLDRFPRAIRVVNKSDQPPQFEMKCLHTVATHAFGLPLAFLLTFRSGKLITGTEIPSKSVSIRFSRH